MRIVKIIAGISFTVLLWCSIGIYLAGQNPPLKMTEYVSNTEDYLQAPTLSDTEIITQKIKSDFSGPISNLIVDNGELAISGNVTIEKLELISARLKVEGVLTVGTLELTGDCLIDVGSHGTLNVTTFQNSVSFNNYAHPKINNYGIIYIENHNADNIVYFCYGRSKTKVEKRTINGDFCLYDRAKLEIPPYAFITVYSNQAKYPTRNVMVYHEEPVQMLKIIGKLELPLKELQIALTILIVLLVAGFLANFLYSTSIKFNPNSQSDFKVNAWKFYLFSLISGLVNFLSLGTLKPFADEYFLRWKWKHTILNGQVLPFTAKGETIFYKNLLWSLLTMITFGVYAFWRRAKMLEWQAKGLPEGVYTGKGIDFFNFALILAGIIFLISGCAFLVTLMLLQFRGLLLILFAIIFAVALLIAYCYLSLYVFKQNLNLTWNLFVIRGTKFSTKFKFPKPIDFILNLICSFGMAIFVYPYYFELNTIRANDWNVQRDETLSNHAVEQ